MRRCFRNFDFVAPAYPLLERASFGDALNVARRAFLRQIARATDVLLVGEGNGRFLAELLARKRGGSVTIIDSSPEMLRLLNKRVSTVRRHAELKVINADFLMWNGEQGRYDAVVTHFFLDLFRPESQLRAIGKITEVSKAGALWVNVDYRVMKTRRLHRLVDWLQYRFDEIFSGVEAGRQYDPVDQISASGWLVEQELQFCGGRVSAQALIKAPKPVVAKVIPAMPRTYYSVSTAK